MKNIRRTSDALYLVFGFDLFLDQTSTTMLEKIFSEIDAINATDPNVEVADGKPYPKELIYGHRMSEMLHWYEPNASFELQIAARGQHIKRWHICRNEYPMDRPGYLKWRTMLKLDHGELLEEILLKLNVNQVSIDQVITLVTKKKLKTDAESQKLEDIACLVFLKYHFLDFMEKHSEEKIISIVQKTWEKMTPKGHELALQLPYSPKALSLVQKALQ